MLLRYRARNDQGTFPPQLSATLDQIAGMRWPVLHFVFSCVLVLPSATVAQDREAHNDSADREVKTGTVLLQEGKYADAKVHFERAQNLEGKPTAQTSAGIGLAELQMGHFASARQMFTLELQLLTNDHARAQAHYMIGSAWLREAKDDNADKNKLQAAEKSFRDAVQLDSLYDLAYFNLGYALLRQDKKEESNIAFRDFIKAAAANPESGGIPPLTSKTHIPEFALSDSTGHSLTPESLHSRFILFDFWATWCPPCLRALPAMRQLSRFLPSNEFVLISVNEDDDRDVWQRFSRAHDMDWTQAWDRNSNLYHDFALTPGSKLSLPRYVLVGPDGFVQHVYSGTDQLGLVVGQVVRTVQNSFPEGQRSN